MKLSSIKLAELKRKIDGIPSVCVSLKDVKKICQHYKIKNSVEYRARYKNIPGLMAHPERVFADEWISYNDLLDIPDFYSYEELKREVSLQGLSSQKDYKSFVKQSQNPRFPLDPQTVYTNQWKNWYRFLGKEEPYTTKFIHQSYYAWGDKIEKFMAISRGGKSKASQLCRFVRHFIESHDYSLAPEIFLTKENVQIRPFREYVDALASDNTKRSLITAVNEFLEYVLEHDLTTEDEDTGEIYRVLNAKNHLSILANRYSPTNTQKAESNKPLLQYFYVKKLQSWIIPSEAKSFRNLTHLHKFDADWEKVDERIIDRGDPDCVYKKVGNQFLLWVPTDWIHLYALTRIPLRGRQIAYNDSGEGDKYIADLDTNGNIIWRKNTSSFAGMTKNQAFVSRSQDDELCTYTTTNKTKDDGRGYSIPWMPEDLAYWLIKLRKWQQQYNPISKPTSWTECIRTDWNEVQLKQKGINCFLFRNFGDVEPKNTSSALTNRLAASLHNIQPTNITLATLHKRENILSHYSSPYTPHSMRVSLITAYIMEMGMPVEVVMKIVGHSSILMTIYYCKISNNEIRSRLEEGEKIALKDQARSTQIMIEQNQIENVKNSLVSTNEEMLKNLSNQVPSGNFVFRDYGICPYAASRCHDGGDLIGNTQVYSSVPVGYLGIQNCLRCRHFITGPAFAGGLLALTNEISLQSNLQSKQCAKLQDRVDSNTERVNQLSREKYMAKKRMQPYDTHTLENAELKLRKAESEYEAAAKKLDVLLCDLQASYRLVRMVESCLNQTPANTGDIALIKMPDAEFSIEVNESSYIEQLQEVCENAVIYDFANASSAIAPRSQLLDRMAALNDIQPSLFMLTEEQQLEAGNQLVSLLLSRLKNWKRVDEVIHGRTKIDELIGDEGIRRSEIELLINKSQPTKVN